MAVFRTVITSPGIVGGRSTAPPARRPAAPPALSPAQRARQDAVVTATLAEFNSLIDALIAAGHDPVKVRAMTGVELRAVAARLREQPGPQLGLSSSAARHVAALDERFRAAPDPYAAAIEARNRTDAHKGATR